LGSRKGNVGPGRPAVQRVNTLRVWESMEARSRGGVGRKLDTEVLRGEKSIQRKIWPLREKGSIDGDGHKSRFSDLTRGRGENKQKGGKILGFNNARLGGQTGSRVSFY